MHAWQQERYSHTWMKKRGTHRRLESEQCLWTRIRQDLEILWVSRRTSTGDRALASRCNMFEPGGCCLWAWCSWGVLKKKKKVLGSDELEKIRWWKRRYVLLTSNCTRHGHVLPICMWVSNWHSDDCGRTGKHVVGAKSGSVCRDGCVAECTWLGAW